MARTDTAVERAARAARQALKTAIGEDYERRRFRIERFGQHRDGYMHARIVVDGNRPVYIHCRFGSWQIPGHVDGKPVLKEPEAMLGTDLGRTVKYTLADEAQRFKAREEAPHADTDASTDTDDGGSDGEAGSEAGLQPSAGRDNASTEVQLHGGGG